MLNLIKNELYKMVCKPLVLVSLALYVGFNFLMFFCWGYNFGNKSDIEKNKEYVTQFEGHFTDEKMQKIYQDFLKEPEIRNNAYEGHSMYCTITNRFMRSDGSLLTLDQSFSNGYDNDVKDNLILADTSGPCLLLNTISKICMFLGAVLIIITAPVFSDEYTLGMDSLILTSKFGKNKVITAKLTASILFSIFVAVGTFLFQTAGFLILYGTSGFSGSVQLNPLNLMGDVPYIMTFSQATLKLIPVWLVASLFISMTSCFLSAVCHTSFLSVIGSLVLFVLPGIAAPFLSRAKVPEEFICLFPFNSASTSVMSISHNYYLFIILFCGVGCVIFSVLSYLAFKNHQVH